VVALAILGVLVVGGVTIGLVVSSGGAKKHDSHQLAPSNGPGGASTHDFPSAEPSGLRTDFASGTGVVTAEQAQIAQNAEDVLHAIATDDAAKFCPLSGLNRSTNCNQLRQNGQEPRCSKSVLATAPCLSL